MPWLRLWTDILDDVDLHALPRETRWGWTAFLAAAKRHNSGGQLPPIKTLAFWTHETDQTVMQWIGELVKVGRLERRDESIFVVDWNKHVGEPRGRWGELRAAVFDRDKWTCTYCGTRKGPFHCDHIIPRAQGGSDELSNLTTACWKCNQSKNGRTPEEWRS